ncbi:VOC family protein [Paenibacillus xylanexedens]|uniref:VOC family protein n=1 Tax=Paenibacillus xylanexedens TaxID=528191 RepID=UPI0011A67A0E|nr:VOC family protein [Paenibacillus xylanexedens]
MKVLSIAHAGMKVKDMERSLQFYCDGLGFKRKFTLYRDEEQSQPWIEYLEFGDKQFVELFYSYEERKERPNLKEYYAMYHLALVVDDIHEAAQQFRAKGIPLKSEPVLGPDHTWQLWIVDPDGNELEIMQYTERSFQLIGS